MLDVHKYNNAVPMVTQGIVNRLAKSQAYKFLAVMYTCETLKRHLVFMGAADARPVSNMFDGNAEDFIKYMREKQNEAIFKGMEPDDISTVVVISNEEQDDYCDRMRLQHNASYRV